MRIPALCPQLKSACSCIGRGELLCDFATPEEHPSDICTYIAVFSDARPAYIRLSLAFSLSKSFSRLNSEAL